MERREIRVATVDSTVASPFAAALLFGYVANYLYDGDAPLAERRAQALSIDQAQLRELLGDAELRDLLDADAIADVEAELQQLHDDRRARTVDGVHDLLLRLGDLTSTEIDARAQLDGRRAADDLTRARRAIAVTIAGKAAPHPGRVREPVSRRARRAAAAGVAGSAARAGATRRAGSRPPLRANARAVHDRRSSPPGMGSDDRPPKRC